VHLSLSKLVINDSQPGYWGFKGFHFATMAFLTDECLINRNQISPAAIQMSFRTAWANSGSAATLLASPNGENRCDPCEFFLPNRQE
jgi:hypothetical protein